MVLNNTKWRQLHYFYSRRNFINSWEIQSDSRFLSIADLSDTASSANAAVARGLAARRPWAELAQRGCCGTSLRSSQQDVFVGYKPVLPCWVLQGGPGKRVLGVLVEVAALPLTRTGSR